MERLYCPDFSSIFGPEFTNPFLLPNIDTQIWPIFTDFKFPEQLTNLLAQKTDEIPHFYHRKITLDQQELELQSSSVEMSLLQSLEIDSENSIPNEFAIKVAKKCKNCKVIFSVYPKNDGFAKIEEMVKKHKKLVAGIVLYPKYQYEFIKSAEFPIFLQWIMKNKLFLKLDFTELHLNKIPKKEVDIPEIISIVTNNTTSISLIITPGDFPSIQLISDKYKYQRNVYMELNLRILGGQSPTKFFRDIFELSGFIQNWWSRIILGSGSPTLETSQLVRGWYEATEELSFKLKNILRMWGFRNICRLMNIKPSEKSQIPLVSYILKSERDNQNNFHLGYDLEIQSFSITQLISIQDLYSQVLAEAQKKYPMAQSGILTLKSYHTTVILIINEHEIGNYLDLHYHFVEECKKDSSECFHTVAAKENRADFNFPDHLVASTYEKSHRTLTYHIRKGKIERGSRENVYVLVDRIASQPRDSTVCRGVIGPGYRRTVGRYEVNGDILARLRRNTDSYRNRYPTLTG